MKKFFKNPWTIGIGTTLIGGVAATIIIDLINKVSIWSTMIKVFNAVWFGIKTFLNLNIKVWWILIAIILIIIILFIISKYLDKKEQKNQGLKPPFLEYTKDYIKGLKWEWSWTINYNGKYDIDKLHPVCNKCETPLLQAEMYSHIFRCPRCNNTITINISSFDEIKIIICDNIKKNSYTV